MYEHKTHPPIARPKFVRRVVLHSLSALGLLLVSLALGMAGYMYYERLSALDAFLNASMLLGGMGPVDNPQSDGGKLFAGMYALYAGLIFLIAAGLIFSPVFHRIIHKFHWDEQR